MSNFWRSLKIPLTNCKIELILICSTNCVIFSNARRDAIAATELSATKVLNAEPAVNVSATNATFKITDTKLYVPVVALQTENDKRSLEQLKAGYKRTIKWKKCRSEMANQTKNNLNYLIDPIFTKVNRLFVLSIENENDRTSFSKYFIPNVQIKDFNSNLGGGEVILPSPPSWFSLNNSKTIRAVTLEFCRIQ